METGKTREKSWDEGFSDQIQMNFRFSSSIFQGKFGLKRFEVVLIKMNLFTWQKLLKNVF